MLNFNYTLDNELKAPIGQLPSGIQTQAFEMALSRLVQGFRQTLKVLQQKVPGIGASAAKGLSAQWRARLNTEIKFIEQLPPRLNTLARQVAQQEVANAVYQSRLDAQWNMWAPLALQTFQQTVRAFQQDVDRAMSNTAVNGMPAIYDKMAMLAKTASPRVPAVNALGAYTGDDAAYLSQFEPAKANPLWLLVGAAALTLWWTSGGGVLPFLGSYDDFLDLV